ncbi:MAG: ATP phosphoribosyltransferase regulatory subunit [Oscillospiraceae bacterium]|nr:ATP phosphoribosyltransferase regulatory subunit [Oscillospiraceae bacterium]
MSEYIYKTPDGTRDFLFEECESHNRIKILLANLYENRGYHEAITPILENYDLFNLESASLTQEEMYKLTDRSGHLLVLRPDITMPIARLASTRLKDAALPLRLYYNQKVFRVNPSLKGKRNEINQSGIELIGASGVLSDLEVITTALNALCKCGIDDLTIEIGHAGIFKKLTESLPADESVKERIRGYIESKSYSSLEDELSDLPESDSVKALRYLPRLFGVREIIKTARDLCGNLINEELDYLNQLLDCLEAEYGDKVRLDLGIVHRNNYYTGMVFRGYIKGSGQTVVSGGRYDKLLSEFGKDWPAIGFAINIDAIAENQRNFKLTNSIQQKCFLVFAEKGYEMKALKYMDNEISNGTICQILPFDNTKSALEIAKVRNAYKFAVVGKEINVISVD